jgi:hypothetical protein
MIVIKKSIPEEPQTYLIQHKDQLSNEGTWEILIEIGEKNIYS